jgi:hypothetical protein
MERRNYNNKRRYSGPDILRINSLIGSNGKAKVNKRMLQGSMISHGLNSSGYSNQLNTLIRRNSVISVDEPNHHINSNIQKVSDQFHKMYIQRDPTKPPVAIKSANGKFGS